MPGVSVRNDTSSSINIAFCFAAPVAFHNDIKPGETIQLPLSSFVHGVEVRQDKVSNRFSSGESWQKGGELAGACAAGTAAVVLGMGSIFGMFGGNAGTLAALTGAKTAWAAAHAGGAQFARKADGVVVSVGGIWIPFHDKNYSIRMIDNDFVLWDEDDDKRLS